jgi:CheB methylesterase
VVTANDLGSIWIFCQLAPQAHTEALPRDCAAAIVVVFHVGAIPSQLPEILTWHGKVPGFFAQDGADLEPGRIYVAPPDHHVLLEGPGRIRLVRGLKVHNTRPAVDPLFASAAATFGLRVVGVVLGSRSRMGQPAFGRSRTTAASRLPATSKRQGCRRCRRRPRSQRLMRKS